MTDRSQDVALPVTGAPTDRPWTPPSLLDGGGADAGDPALVAGLHPTSGVASPPSTTWRAAVPLGGFSPEADQAAAASPRRDLVLTSCLLLAAVAAAASSLLSWRDLGPFAPGSETGWRQLDGSLGRGWVAVLGGVLLAVAGVLVAAERPRSGRALATVTGIGLMVFSVLEWGLGTRNLRSGPGPGLWVLFLVGMLVVVAVGVLAPDTQDGEPTDG